MVCLLVDYSACSTHTRDPVLDRKLRLVWKPLQHESHNTLARGNWGAVTAAVQFITGCTANILLCVDSPYPSLTSLSHQRRPATLKGEMHWALKMQCVHVHGSLEMVTSQEFRRQGAPCNTACMEHLTAVHLPPE